MVIDLIKKDSRLRKLLRMLEKGSFAFECAKSIQEVQDLHTKRPGRDLTVSQILNNFQSKMINSVLATQENRTRIVEIKIQAFKIHAKLDKHTGLVKKHLRSLYSTQLNRMAGTAVDRDSTLESLLEKPLNHLKDLKTLLEVCEICINDLDQIGWANKSVISIMEQEAGRKTAKF